MEKLMFGMEDTRLKVTQLIKFSKYSLVNLSVIPHSGLSGIIFKNFNPDPSVLTNCQNLRKKFFVERWDFFHELSPFINLNLVSFILHFFLNFFFDTLFFVYFLVK